jgi:hypothetical protein
VAREKILLQGAGKALAIMRGKPLNAAAVLWSTLEACLRRLGSTARTASGSPAAIAPLRSRTGRFPRMARAVRTAPKAFI